MRKFDLNLSSELEIKNSQIPNYSVYLGKNTALEIKEYRKQYYLCFLKYSDRGEIKNRFNINIDQIGTMMMGLEKIQEFLKNQQKEVGRD